MTGIVEGRHLGASYSADVRTDLHGRLSNSVKNDSLYLFLQHIGKLVAVRLENLDSVVFAGIVRSGYHHRRIIFIFFDKERNRRRGKHTELHYVRTDRAKTCRDRRAKHI